MVTPRKPGAKRGRPRKARAAPNPVGRPPNNLLADPDRYAIAFADVLRSKVRSRRDCCLMAAAHFLGRETNAKPSLRHPAKLRVSFEKNAAISQNISLAGYAETLRAKCTSYMDPICMIYRWHLAEAIRETL